MARRRSRGNTRKAVMALVVALLAGALGIATDGSAPILQRLGLPAETTAGAADQSGREAESARTLASVPAYGDSPYVYIAADGDHPQGAPVFTDTELARAASGAFESYSPLDALGRCGTALACVGRETMPTAERGDIGSVHPTGWRQRFYDFVDDRALYNRCHLIAHALAGEDANAQNLITGTRYMNTQGMLPFEEQVAGYIDRTGNHVLYRVTPIFSGDELVARGVHMEARSVEDDGAGVRLNVYCYNVEPGVGIDYATGDSWAE